MARQVAAPPVSRDQRLTMSYDDYLTWTEEEGHIGEWVDGEVIVFEMPSERHQDLLGFLYILLSWYARRLDLGKVLFAPFEMRRLDRRAARLPDLVFIAREHADRLTGIRLEGAADLAIELISPDSVRRDRRDKLAEYGTAGVLEYWLFDTRPRRWQADFLQLQPDGSYLAIAPDEAGRYHSLVVPGFWLEVDWLRQDPLPDPFALLPIIAPALGQSPPSAPDQTPPPNGA